MAQHKKGSTKPKPGNPGEKKLSGRSNIFSTLKFQASSVYFNNLIGSDLTINEVSENNRIPAVMRFNLLPNYNTRSDMVNVAATSVYSFVRHANAGRANYEASDLMVYLLAITEIFVAITHAGRALGTVNFFVAANRNVETLVTAMGFDLADLRSNQADYRYRINTIINKMRAFAIPKAFDYMADRMKEVSEIYADEDSLLASFYLFRPQVIGSFNGEQAGGSTLVFTNIDSSGFSNMGTFLGFIETLVTRLRANEDCNIMSGDIMKAYGSDLMMLQAYPENFLIAPIFDALKLAQIQNIQVFQSAWVEMVQHNNRLECTIHSDSLPEVMGKSIFDAERLVNSPIADVTPDLLFELTRYQYVAEVNHSDMTGHIISAGPTLVSSADFVLWNQNGSGVLRLAANLYTSEDPSPATLVRLTKFRSHPYFWVLYSALPIGDVVYPAILDSADINRIQDARFIAAFQTAQMF